MSAADSRALRDWVNDRSVSFLVWRLPLLVLVGSLLLPLGAVERGVVWALSLGVFGAACVANARRCGRLHCYFTGPFFLLMAGASLLHGLGALPLGAPGFAWLGGATLVGGLALTFLPERILGRYAGGG